MATISLGKVALTWKGMYSPSAAYAVQDVVSYNGSSYVCKAATTGVAPPDQTKWDVAAQGVSGISTNVGDLLYFDGTSLVPLPAGTPGHILRVGTNGLPEWSIPNQRSGMRAVDIQDYRMKHMYRRGFAVMADGTMRFWGRGTNWVLGQGNDQVARSYPVRVAFPPTAAPIVRAWGQYDSNAYALDASGKFWGWGQNDYGELGRGNTTDTYTPVCISDIATANSIYGKTVVDYAPMVSTEGYSSAMVLCSDGTVHTTGYNGYGQLGQGDVTQRTNFVQVPLLSNIVKIVRGRERYTSCYALKSDGTVYAWGYNVEGQLGVGNTTQLNIPTLISYFTTNNKTIVDIGTGAGTAWAIDSAGVLYTWGYNGYGNLGHSGTTNQSTPVAALTNVGLCDMSGTSADYNRSVAIKNDGSVWATGDNSYGCLGVAADTTDRSSFVECKKADGTSFNNAVKALLGGTGSYNWMTVLDNTGVCWSVGYSGNGQMGTGNFATTNYWFSPVLIHRRKVVDFCLVGASSEGGTIFLMDDGQVYQTGYAGEAQLPEDDSESISVPMPVIF